MATPLKRKELYEFSDFRLDVSERLLLRRGKRLPLAEKAFETLCVLVRRGGSLISKDELIGLVWPDCAVEDNSLDKNVSLLRKTLGDNKPKRPLIETVRGHGYRFVASVRLVDQRNGDNERSNHRDSSQPDHTPGATAVTAADNSIAVLPFKNLSPESDNDYFCDGVAEELLNTLAKAGNLKVAARTSAFSFRDRDVSVQEIGRILHVKAVLEGSVRRSRDNFRVTVRLINTADGYTIWSESYDREIDDIFDVQDEIALAVVDSLRIKLAGDERRAVLKRHTASTNAYLLYLKGQYHRWKTTPQDFAHSLKYFEQSVEADPSFALGYFGISTYYGYGTAWGLLPIRPDKGWSLAESFAAKVVELDDSIPELRLSLAAFSLVNYRRRKEAGGEIAAIASANPNFPEIRHVRSFYLLATGKFDEAIAEAKHALALDPLSMLFSRFLGICLYYSRRCDEAIEQLHGTLELEPNNPSTHGLMAEVYFKMGMVPEAIAARLREARLADDDETAAALASPSAEKNITAIMHSIARRRIDSLNELAAHVEYVPSIHYAREYIVLGEIDKAFDWLQRSCDEHNVFPLLMNSDPFYDTIRSDPRYPQLLEMVGYPTD